MWMMGYNESGHHEFNTPDFQGRKLRPIIPRPVMPSTNNNSSSTRINGTDFSFAHNHHLATGDQSKRLEFNAQQVIVSSRWNPTPEQLRTLEDLYRRGTRTPSAEQIQHITAELRRYGKIEGKNVFYWFQNHKARERQKRRRQKESGPLEQPHHDNIEALETKYSGENRTNHEVEQTKNWTPSSDCSTLPEQSISMQRAAKATPMAELCRPVDHGGWIQFDGHEDQLQQQQKRNFINMERNATWQMMQLSCGTHHLINTTTSTATPTTPPPPNTNTAASTVLAPAILSRMDQKYLFKSHDQLSIFKADHDLNSRGACNEEEDDENGFGESQTLELFPLHSSNNSVNMAKEKESTHDQELAMDANNLTSYQFFEFLPLKN